MASFKRYNAECNWFEEIWKSLKYEKWLFLKVFQWNVKLGLNFIKALAQVVHEEIDWEGGQGDAPERWSGCSCSCTFRSAVAIPCVTASKNGLDDYLLDTNCFKMYIWNRNLFFDFGEVCKKKMLKKLAFNCPGQHWVALFFEKTASCSKQPKFPQSALHYPKQAMNRN